MMSSPGTGESKFHEQRVATLVKMGSNSPLESDTAHVRETTIALPGNGNSFMPTNGSGPDDGLKSKERSQMESQAPASQDASTPPTGPKGMEKPAVSATAEKGTVPPRRRSIPAGHLAAISRGEHVPPEIHEAALREQYVLNIERFNLWYGKKQALYDISMGVPSGMVTAMIGPSGCGKSTLLRCVNRMNDLLDTVRIQGEMRLNNDSIYNANVDVIELRKRMGMVFQKPNPFPMSIYENVIYSLRIDGERDRSVLDDVCEKSLRGAAIWDEVKDRLHESALGLSGGQQQRLCIARAIAGEPEVLLLDEPCSALDPIATGKVEDLIRELKGAYSILIVTHNMQQAARISDYTAFMYLGHLIEYGPTVDIFTNPHLADTNAYLTGHFG